jgi:hypothetical protein
MDYTTFKSYIHPKLLAQFTTADSNNITHEDVLQNSLTTAQNDYSAFASSVIEDGGKIRFSEDVYELKRALSLVYRWMLQNEAFLQGVNLSGVVNVGDDLYVHFSKLRDAEESDIEKLRQDTMDELIDKIKPGTNGARLNFAPRRFLNGRYF